MNEKQATYVDIKHLPAKKQRQKEKVKDQPVYTEVKICTSNSNETKTRKMQSSTEKGSSVPFAWHLTAMILGICCFFLLLTVGVLGFSVFQGQKTRQAQTLLLDNITQEEKITQEDKSTLKNMNCIGLPLNTGNKNGMCKTQWSCCEDKCYHFSREFKNYEDSRQLCKAMGSKLVKIEDEKELKFIQNQVFYFTWIGLSRKGISSFWTWEDKSTPLLNMSSDWKESKDGNCVSMTAMRMAVSDCSKLLPSICEKRIASVAT